MSKGPQRETRAADGLRGDDKDFRLLSISATRTPSGCSGPDWFVYKIAQGDNIITGYRRGDSHAVNAEVETIVASLNSRRRSMKAPTGPKPGRKPAAAAAAPAAPAVGDDD